MWLKNLFVKVHLGINTGFVLNRFTTPEEWIPLVAEVFHLRVVQFTADLLNPSLPDEIIEAYIRRINTLTKTYGLRIHTTFTSAFTRLNHLAHPDPLLREYGLKWFYRFVDIAVALGAEGMGSHLGILTVKDYQDHKRRGERLRQNIEGWQKISQYAAKKGLKYLMWEPMSIGREFGETIDETRRIQDLLNKNSALPMRLCIDVDHGDVMSSNPRDTDPYAWIEAFAREIAVIHIKQSSADKSGHWAFTPQKNREGKITAPKLLSALEKSGVETMMLMLELSFREREPFDSRVVSDIKASVEYWRPFVEVGI